jgi:hypothetical protein
VRVYYLCIDIPHSDACFVKVYLGEVAEAWCDGHVDAFTFFGGVPLSILYDNSKRLVAQILGDGRRVCAQLFSELQSPPYHQSPGLMVKRSGISLKTSSAGPPKGTTRAR